jgi:hypothetical protein
LFLCTLALCPAADEIPTASADLDSTARAVLTNVIQVHEFPVEQIGMSNEVRVRGVMTFVMPQLEYGFVQDATAGAVVFWDAIPPPAAGQVVEIEGQIGATVFTPIIKHAILHRIRPGEFPKPLRVSFADLWAGRADCQWVEVEGMVRSATMMTNGLLVLRVDLGGRQILKASICVPGDVDRSAWVNSRVRIDGVACGSFNSKRQFIAPNCWCLLWTRSAPWHPPRRTRIRSLSRPWHRWVTKRSQVSAGKFTFKGLSPCSSRERPSIYAMARTASRSEPPK